MALTLLASNNATSVLASSISATATTLSVNSGTGSLFPSPVDGTTYFKLTLVDAATGTLTEIVHVTARSEDVFTIQRAQEGTTARVWSANDIVANMLTAGSFSVLAQINTQVPVAAATQSNHAVQLGQISSVVTGVVGLSRNAKMSVTTPSATATFQADEILVNAGLGGSQYRIGSFSKTINLATTGAGGMDTGTVPATGFVAVYAIYNPTTGASSLLAVNATSTVAPEVYSGSNMPSGYTASALVSVWGVSASKLILGYQCGRSIKTQQISLLTTSSPVTTATALAVTPAAPLNARKVTFAINVTQGQAGSACGIVMQADLTGIGAQGQLSAASSGTSPNGMIIELPIISSGQVYYVMNNSNAGTFSVKSVGYEI